MKNAPALGGGAGRNNRTADVCNRLSTSTGLPAQTLRAELIGDTCTAGGITARGSSPVLALCRLLIKAGHNPATTLHVYRGALLALTVRLIGEAVRLRVAPHGVGFERLPACTTASPMRQTGAAAMPAGKSIASVQGAS